MSRACMHDDPSTSGSISGSISGSRYSAVLGVCMRDDPSTGGPSSSALIPYPRSTASPRAGCRPPAPPLPPTSYLLRVVPPVPGLDAALQHRPSRRRRDVLLQRLPLPVSRALGPAPHVLQKLHHLMGVPRGVERHVIEMKRICD